VSNRQLSNELSSNSRALECFWCLYDLTTAHKMPGSRTPIRWTWNWKIGRSAVRARPWPLVGICACGQRACAAHHQLRPTTWRFDHAQPW